MAVDGAAASDRIASVVVATIRAALPKPIAFGDWVMRHREFALVRIATEQGLEGFGFTLTREGPVASIIRRSIAHHYIGQPFDNPERLFYAAQWSNNAVLKSGVGLRALSIVDLATWDLAAKGKGISIAEYLGGAAQSMPATAIIGYPPTLGGEEVRQQVAELYAAGWRRFKAPIAATPELTRQRLQAAAAAATDVVVSMDAAWAFRDVDTAVQFLESLNVKLGWFEDVFPPGDAAIVAALRNRVAVPIAMGDEQGGSYYPEALLAARAVDVVRIDTTCMGGITRARPTIEMCNNAGVAFAPHMFAHVHSQIFSGLGYPNVPVEWGVRWTGVDQYADSLAQPTVIDGFMQPLDRQPGFGTLVNPDWLAEQQNDDPEGLIAILKTPGGV